MWNTIPGIEILMGLQNGDFFRVDKDKFVDILNRLAVDVHKDFSAGYGISNFCDFLEKLAVEGICCCIMLI